jgi:hypothetical protein
MNYTLAIKSPWDHDSLEWGLGHERFLLGPARARAALSFKNRAISPKQPYALLNLVHIHATSDHLVLTNPNDLFISADESQALYESIQEILHEISDTLEQVSPDQWLIKADPLRTLATTSIEQAVGHNIDHWMPKDTSEAGIARRWRKWQNEIQMIWFDHPVNIKRMEQGVPPINSLWISGIGCLEDFNPDETIKNASSLYSSMELAHQVANFLELPISHTPLEQTGIAILNLDDLDTEVLWSSACKALEESSLNTLTLIDFPNGQTRKRSFKKDDLPSKGWLFWKKSLAPSLKGLVQEGRNHG